MDWTNKVYEELNEFERFTADKLIESALDRTLDCNGNAPYGNDRIVIREYLRENLSTLNRANEHKKD